MNKRVIIGAVIGVTFFLFAHRPASAMAEFCPAALEYHAVGAPGVDQSAPSQIYGIALTGLSPRTVTTATLAFDTTAGWYTVKVPAVSLHEKDRHYHGEFDTFIRRDFVSPVLYVRFPVALAVANAWVLTATAQGDTEFGWEQQGAVPCSPGMRKDLSKKPVQTRSPSELDPKDEDPLSGAPSSGALMLSAQSSAPLASSACAQPFRDALVTKQATPQFPDLQQLWHPVVASVEVAINPDGSLADAWIWSTSGYKALDEAAVRAAEDSQYSGARAYCSAVPAKYFFRVTFAPN